MPGKLDCYNLGALGVNVEKNPVELEDGELIKSQNAIHDSNGSMGSLRKRAGLTKLNSVAAAGAIAGMIGVPIGIGTAGNDGALTPSPAVEPTTRAYIAARRTGTTTSGWNTSTDGWTTSPTTGGPDGYLATATPRVPDYMWTGFNVTGDTIGKVRGFLSGRPGCVYNNRFYYAGNDYTYSTGSPTIRMWDGVQDFLIAKLPVTTFGVIDMILGGNSKIYLTSSDSGAYASNTMKSSIWELDPEGGQLTKIGSQFPITPETVRVPFTLCWHTNRLWTRTHGAGITAINQLVYYYRPGVDTDWVLDATEAAIHNTSCMASYQGRLFMGGYQDVGSNIPIRVRSALGVYSDSLTPALNEGGSIATMASFGWMSGFTAMAQFGGNLYAAYYNQEGLAGTDLGNKFARIYKYDGTTWSAVFGPVANNADCLPYSTMTVIGGRLYFVSAPARTDSATINRMLYTTNGSSFTSVTTSILDDASGALLASIAS